MTEREKIEADIAALQARIALLEGALGEVGDKMEALCFADMGKDEDEGVVWTTQEVWETIYRDRVQDWFSFEDLDAARTTLASVTAMLEGGNK